MELLPGGLQRLLRLHWVERFTRPPGPLTTLSARPRAAASTSLSWEAKLIFETPASAAVVATLARMKPRPVNCRRVQLPGCDGTARPRGGGQSVWGSSALLGVELMYLTVQYWMLELLYSKVQ